MSSKELYVRMTFSGIGLIGSFAFSYWAITRMLQAVDPTYEAKKRDALVAAKRLASLGLKGVELSEYEMAMARDLIDPASVTTSWSDLGGLNSLVEEICATVILPFTMNSDNLSALIQPPKGVLLYGPPGCGKTLLARAIAHETDARFINLQISTLLDKWYGEAQKRTAAAFSLARKLQPCIIFVDEIDSLLRSREGGGDHEATNMLKTQFMTLWDGLVTDKQCRVVLIGATNRPQDLDPAIKRRMPAQFKISLPDEAQREDILRVILKNEDLEENVVLAEIAASTARMSGSDLQELCRLAGLTALRDSGTTVLRMRKINQRDLTSAAATIGNQKKQERRSGATASSSLPLD